MWLVGFRFFREGLAGVDVRIRWFQGSRRLNLVYPSIMLREGGPTSSAGREGSNGLLTILEWGLGNLKIGSRFSRPVVTSGRARPDAQRAPGGARTHVCMGVGASCSARPGLGGSGGERGRRCEYEHERERRRASEQASERAGEQAGDRGRAA